MSSASTTSVNTAREWLGRFAKLAKVAAPKPLSQVTGQFDPSRTLAFMHIPKTGGTSFAEAVVNAVQSRSVVRGFDMALLGDFVDVSSLDTNMQQYIYTSPHSVPDGQFICGHFSLHTIRQRYPGAQVVGLLREPFSRLLSFWLYWRGRPEEEIAAWRAWGDRMKQSYLPLTAFLNSRTVACQTDNIVVRMLLWPHRLIPAADFISPRHDKTLLAEAFVRLAHFSLLDVAENPDLGARLGKWLEVPLLLERRNVTRPIPELLRGSLAEELTPEAFDSMDARSRLDLRLWHHVAQKSVQPRYLGDLQSRARLQNVARHARLMAT